MKSAMIGIKVKDWENWNARTKPKNNPWDCLAFVPIHYLQ